MIVDAFVHLPGRSSAMESIATPAPGKGGGPFFVASRSVCIALRIKQELLDATQVESIGNLGF